jgi:hypothetical protein
LLEPEVRGRRQAQTKKLPVDWVQELLQTRPKLAELWLEARR